MLSLSLYAFSVLCLVYCFLIAFFFCHRHLVLFSQQRMPMTPRQHYYAITSQGNYTHLIGSAAHFAVVYIYKPPGIPWGKLTTWHSTPGRLILKHNKSANKHKTHPNKLLGCVFKLHQQFFINSALVSKRNHSKKCLQVPGDRVCRANRLAHHHK